MTKALNTNNVIPLESPYTVAPFNAPSTTAPAIPADATDWILIEVRDASAPATIISQTSGFILDNGNVVAADGSEFRIKDAPGSGHIAVRHRNHLSIRTASPMNLNNPPALYDFSTGTGQAYTDTNITSNANMRNVGGVFAMWAGDVNSNSTVLYNGGGNDRVPILSLVGGTANANIPLLNQYTNHDCNLDSSVIYNGAGSDRVVILSTVGGTANANLPINSHF
jgi:hypothetical protein